MSYILLAFAIILGIVAVVLFFTLKIPKAYRAVKGQKKKKRIAKKRITKKVSSSPKTKKLKESFSEDGETMAMHEDEVHFNMLQDITFVHVDEEM